MKTALITGASSGMGREFARELFRRGLCTGFVLVARRKERLNALAEELTARGAEWVLPISTDLTEEGAIAALHKTLSEQGVRLSYLVNAAGFGVYGAYDQLSEETAAGMIDLNVRAAVLINHRLLPLMEKGGHVVMLGSASSFTALPYFSVYAASKAFILHYAKALRVEAREHGIFVTCLCPGWVDTEFLPLAEGKKGIPHPKSYTPLLSPEKVVRVAITAAEGRRFYAVTGWYTKLQHLLSKLLPSRVMTRLWLGMLEK